MRSNRVRARTIPKGLRPPAQGCEVRATLGKRSKQSDNRNAVAAVSRVSYSIPNVFFIPFDFVSFQQRAQLVLKTNLAVMLLLSGDVIPHRCNLRKADGENSVAVLPREKPCKSGLLVFTQSDEPRFTSLTIAAASQVRDRAHNKWTWSSIPPTMIGWQSRLVRIPPR